MPVRNLIFADLSIFKIKFLISVKAFFTSSLCVILLSIIISVLEGTTFTFSPPDTIHILIVDLCIPTSYFFSSFLNLELSSLIIFADFSIAFIPL